MTSRLLTGFIVCFWLVMTSMLIRLEINPDKSDLLAVPPSHVLKLMFTHGQTSELDILEHGTPVGNLALHPKVDPDSGQRSLGFSGNFLMHASGGSKKQRITWDGTLEMDRLFNTTDFDLSVTFREPAYRVHLKFDPPTKKVDYEVKEGGGHTVRNSSLTLDEAGAASLLRDEFGVDPASVQNLRNNFAAPVFSAKQTELQVRKEKVIAYLLTIKQGEITVGEIYVSQLGQILTAKTIFGYSFNAEDMMPSP